MEERPTCKSFEWNDDLAACWRFAVQQTQCVACLWCIARELFCTGKCVLMRSTPLVQYAPRLMRSAPLQIAQFTQ